MFLPQPTAASDSLQFEPDDCLNAHRVGVVVHGTEAIRKALRIDLPCTGVDPGTIVDVPAGVHPPVIQLDILLAVMIEEHFLALLVGSGHLAVPKRAGTGQQRSEPSASRTRQVVCEHPFAPNALAMTPG